MKKNVQKLLSIVLTVIMMISMLPFSVFAADLDVYDVEEPAVEAVSVPAEEQEIESTVEDVLVGNAETEDELLVEDAEIVEDSSEEIETVDAADPAEADADVVIEESETDETLGALNDGYVDVGGNNFPNSFTYSGYTYTKSGNPVALNASYRIQGLGQTNWLNEYGLNGQQVNPGKIYYQEYTSGGSRRIVVYEIPSLIEVMQGTGLYMSPGSLHNGMVDVGSAEFDTSAISQRVNANGTVTSKGVISNLEYGRITYGFDTTHQTTIQSGTIDVEYTVRSGSNSYVVPTYTIKYVDGVNETVFPDQVYTDNYAAQGHNTPHFKWNGDPGDPVRPGYRFTGWKDQNGEVYANSDAVTAVTITGDATYTAQWAPNSITVSKQVVVGDGVEASEINHTIYIALWDGSGYLKKADGKINYKEITVTNGVASGPVVFNENDLLESKDYTVWELAEVEGDDPSALREIEVNGKTIHVQVQAYELNADGDPIANDNNTHLNTTNTAYIKLTNTYTSDFTSFTLNKRWYDVNGNDVTSSIKDVTATITLYKTDSDGVTTEAGSIVLDGTADGNGESSAWKAEFTNLNSAYTYKAKETSCSLGYHAYQANDYAQPMGDNDYKVFSGQTICNLPDRYGIYHSSNGTTEWFAVGENIKLVDEVEPGYLYGGYYKYTETGNHKGPALDTYAKTGLDEDFTATENNTIYYLKEVEDTYFVPRIFITYDANEGHDPKYALRGLYAIMDLDSSCVNEEGGVYGEYVDYGFIIGDNIQITSNTGFICQTLEVDYPDKDKETHTVKTMFNTGTDEDRLFVRDLTADYLTDTTASEFKLRAYFKTPDGVIVTGKKQRIVHMGDRVFASQSWNKTDWEEGENGIWQETPKDGAGNYTPGSEAVAATSRSLGVSTTIPSVRTYQIKSTPDILTYTVTKIDDGKNESQVVQAGDNTGKITYAGKTGYVFAGWYLDKAYTKAADFSVVTGDMTVYAKYVKATAIGLSFTKKSSKSGSVTLNATLKITGAPDLADAAVSCDYKGKTSTVKFTGAKTTKSGKTTVSTYTGTVAISGLANKSSFKAAISYKTPDGTYVSLADKTCKYTSGKVTVK